MFGRKNKTKTKGYPHTNNLKLEKRQLVWGYTFTELLIAVTIFSVVASVIYSSFRVGIISWKRTEANLSRYQKIRHALNSLNKDISNTFMHKGILFKGQEKRIEFAAFLKDNGAKLKTIGKVSYFISSRNEQDATGALMMQKLEYWQIKEEEQGSEGAQAASGGEELVSGVIDFNINYCYKESEEENAPMQWMPEWKSEEAIPIGVKIELVLKDDAAAEGKRTFIKRIYIPTGAFGKQEEL